MLKEFKRTLIEPEFSTWANIIKNNIEILSPFPKTVRSDLLELSMDYSTNLNDLAQELGLPTLKTSVRGSSNPIAMTGHQPTIYHCGIFFKNIMLGKLAQEQALTPINLIMDADWGDAGALLYPKQIQNETAILSASLVENPKAIFKEQRLIEQTQLKMIFTDIVSALDQFGFKEISRRVAYANSLYSKLSALDAVRANTIVRRAYFANLGIQEPQLDLPLTQLVQLKEVQAFLIKLASDRNLHALYNSILENFRQQRKIKNPANPFPNMSQRQENGKVLYELPFWIFNTTTHDKRALFMSDENKLILNQGEIIIPRGMTITLLLRLLCADVFIHGRGGAKYDLFTDQFITQYYKLAAPAFVVASADQYLFEKEVQELEVWENGEVTRRQMAFALDKHLGKNEFRPDIEEKLKSLNQLRGDLRQRLSLLQSSGESSSSVTREMKSINEEIKGLVDENFKPVKLYSAATRNTLFCREFPFFFFL